jgi:hypothetical protein
MQRHPYEWTSLAENQWPHDGRKLTATEAWRTSSRRWDGRWIT